MKKTKQIKIALIIGVFSILGATSTVAQSIKVKTVKKHLYTLAADDMGGRKPGTEGIEKAARYIENEYKKYG